KARPEGPRQQEPETHEYERGDGTAQEESHGAKAFSPGREASVAGGAAVAGRKLVGVRQEEIERGAEDEGRRALLHEKCQAEENPAGYEAQRRGAPCRRAPDEGARGAEQAGEERRRGG